jgi:hypothetical protein
VDASISKLGCAKTLLGDVLVMNARVVTFCRCQSAVWHVVGNGGVLFATDKAILMHAVHRDDGHQLRLRKERRAQNAGMGF